MTRRGWALFAAMAVIWGIPYLLIKIAVGQLTPASLVFLRTAIGAALLLPVAAARGWLTPLLTYWRWVLVYTIVEVSLPWFLLADGERRLSSSLTGLMIAAVPLLAVVLQLLTRGDERTDGRRVAGMLVGFVGVAVLVGLNVSFKDLRSVGEVGLVALGYAAGPIIIARRLPSLPAVGVVAASLVLTALFYSPVAATAKRDAVEPGTAGRPDARGGVHGARLPALLRVDQRSRPGQGHRDHLLQPGGRLAARRGLAPRTLHRRRRRRFLADPRGVGAGDEAD